MANTTNNAPSQREKKKPAASKSESVNPNRTPNMGKVDEFAASKHVNDKRGAPGLRSPSANPSKGILINQQPSEHTN